MVTAKRKTGVNQRLSPALPVAVGELEPNAEGAPEIVARLAALHVLARQGDAQAATALVEAFDRLPELWETLSGLQENAERSWIDMIAPDWPGQEVTRAAIWRELDRQRRAVAGTAPSPLERLLADRVVLSWLAATHADAQYARRLAEGMTNKENEFLQRRCERAQRQLLKAIQTLATVRRLLTPSVQVNIADKQINVTR